MKAADIPKEHKEELEKFGANTWFLDYLSSEYSSKPEQLPETWKEFLGTDKLKSNGDNSAKFRKVELPPPFPEDETKIIAGSSARILENMENSLSIPVATSQRSIPVKLLEENRQLINGYLKKKNAGKISFTHIIGWAIIKSLQKIPAMNNAFSEVDGRPLLVKRKHINLGLAIDVERKDGSHSLLVPNIRSCESLTFAEYFEKYESLVERSRTGKIDPSEFMGTTITLTNPGTIGTVASMPRLMLGQGAIIATGAIQYPAEYQAMSPQTISNLGISKILNITSTYDHRIIQGAESGLFLKEMHQLLLGEGKFYDEIFQSLKIPLKPIYWETDILPQGQQRIGNVEEIVKQARVIQLINIYRVRGHLVAEIDPLGTNKIYHEELDINFHKLTLWDLDRTFVTGGFGGIQTATLREILGILQRTYCEKIGVEYMHIQNHEEKTWLQNMMEPVENKPKFDAKIKKRILKKLVEAEGLEHFIHNKFIGHKRFSLEGSETTIAVLDYLLGEASIDAVDEIVLGMAHRGRLNVLTNIVGKNYEALFSEFEDILDPTSFAGSGDVKYHLGATGTYSTVHETLIGVSITSNPSHLEWVNPVVEGIVRAKQTRIGDNERRRIIPVLIHGDAAFAGQGVVAETINLSQLKGYATGGTVHFIINNQIGFTTTPEDSRSTVYATDVAKMVQAPIFHVNGDDPEAALWVVKLAFLYRQKFKKDVVIDLLGYRRHGHNEGDEPGFTQPLLYEKIKSHPSVLEIYAKKLIKDKLLSQDEVEKIKNQFSQQLDEMLERVKKKKFEFKIDLPLAVSKEKIKGIKHTHKTEIDEILFDELVMRSTAFPDNVEVHPKVIKLLEGRRKALNGTPEIDWAFGETLAFGSLLYDKVPIRLSGQDSVRGTFSQRHLSITDLKTGDEYFPLNHMFAEQGRIEALDSSLSEAGVIGFEYGFSTADPLTLVLWEAQFGDFANSGQVIIDNFVVASFEKWSAPNNLVMLLPHGYEGQGPEHSSARLERFLILCAQENMEVCYPTTPAQYFHLLRRHMKKGIQRPLVIMTPKSMLRLNDARSKKDDFVHGTFREVIDDASVHDKNKIKRIVLTSGKIYYELMRYRESHNIEDTALVRIEQFYPYDDHLMKELLRSYYKANKVLWVQEEPKNMGAWNFLHQRLFEDLAEGQKLLYVGRPEQASPAVGSSKVSNKQQQTIIEDSFRL